MVVSREILFLLGTISAFVMANPLKPTEIIIEKHTEPKFAEKLTHYGLPDGYPPFISNFLEHGTNIFFKPLIMLSPAFAPGREIISDNKEACKKWPMVPAFPIAATPQFVLDEPVKIVETMVSGAEIPTVDKVVFIKPPSPMKPEPTVPPMVIYPSPVINEELVEVPVSSPIVQPELPPLPIISEPSADVFQPAVIEQFKPTSIPEAPELPPISIPEVLVPSLPTVPVLEPVESHDNDMSLNIPDAPQLPPYSPPKLPLPVVMKEVLIEFDKQNKTEHLDKRPILIEVQPSVIENLEHMIIPLPPGVPPSAEILVSQPALEDKPVEIPQAPVLLEFQEPKPMDIPIPEIVVTHQEEVKPIFPITIPNPPKLTPMPVPDFPTSVVVPEPISPELPIIVESKPVLIQDNKYEAVEIPAPPVLPPMAPVLLPDVVSEPIATAPELPLLDEPKPVLIEESKFEPSPMKPELTVPPMVIYPSPVINEELVKVPVSFPIVQPNLPPLPIISEPSADVFQPAVIEEFKPTSIPETPELPPISIPEVLVPSLPTVPVLEPVESHDNDMSLNIPDAPELSPYLPPKLPLSVVMKEVLIECHKQNKTEHIDERPIIIEVQPSVIENLEHMMIPLPPVLPPSAEILVPQPALEDKLVEIPQAPVLPEFQEPKPMDIPIPEIVVSHHEEVKPIFPITIPNPPKLTPMPVPDFPLSVVIPEPISPELPILVESKPVLIEDNKYEAVEIPAPPVLPPMTPVLLPAVVSEPIATAPDLPLLDEPKPVLIEESKFEPTEIPALPPVSIVMTEPFAIAPELPEVVSNEISIPKVPEYVRPILIPEAPLLPTPSVAEEISIQKGTSNIPVAPELPPLPFPSIPIIMEGPMTALYPPVELKPMLIEEHLPQILDNKPLFMKFAETAKIAMSEIESFISFPTTCVKNIVIERVLPNIVRKRKFEVFSSSNYPVLSSYSPTIGRLF